MPVILPPRQILAVRQGFLFGKNQNLLRNLFPNEKDRQFAKLRKDDVEICKVFSRILQVLQIIKTLKSCNFSLRAFVYFAHPCVTAYKTSGISKVLFRNYFGLTAMRPKWKWKAFVSESYFFPAGKRDLGSAFNGAGKKALPKQNL